MSSKREVITIKQAIDSAISRYKLNASTKGKLIEITAGAVTRGVVESPEPSKSFVNSVNRKVYADSALKFLETYSGKSK